VRVLDPVEVTTHFLPMINEDARTLCFENKSCPIFPVVFRIFPVPKKTVLVKLFCTKAQGSAPHSSAPHTVGG
jgi:hypothetical protein